MTGIYQDRKCRLAQIHLNLVFQPFRLVVSLAGKVQDNLYPVLVICS
jgi:hypothetical protein